MAKKKKDTLEIAHAYRINILFPLWDGFLNGMFNKHFAREYNGIFPHEKRFASLSKITKSAKVHIVIS